MSASQRNLSSAYGQGANPWLRRIRPPYSWDVTTPGWPIPDTGTPTTPASPGFFDIGQSFLGGLLRGEIPEPLRAMAQRGLEESQRALNAELQKRGAYFSTPGLQMQQRLATDYGTNLASLMAERAMGAIPQAVQLYGLGSQLGNIPSDVPNWYNSAIQLLGALRGQVVQPEYTPDPWGGLLGTLLGIFGGKWF